MSKNKKKLAYFCLTTYGRSLPKEIGDRSKWTYCKLYKRIRDKYKINYLCTDGYEAYNKFYTSRKETYCNKSRSIKPKNDVLEPSLRSNRALANTRAKVLIGEIVQAHFPLPLHLHNHFNLLIGKVRNEFTK